MLYEKCIGNGYSCDNWLEMVKVLLCYKFNIEKENFLWIFPQSKRYKKKCIRIQDQFNLYLPKSLDSKYYQNLYTNSIPNYICHMRNPTENIGECQLLLIWIQKHKNWHNKGICNNVIL